MSITTTASPRNLRGRAERLREQARQARANAAYADGAAYRREMDEADSLERMASTLERQAQQLEQASENPL